MKIRKYSIRPKENWVGCDYDHYLRRSTEEAVLEYNIRFRRFNSSKHRVYYLDITQSSIQMNQQIVEAFILRYVLPYLEDFTYKELQIDPVENKMIHMEFINPN